VARFLYLLSRWCFQRRKTVLVAWLGALVLAFIGAAALSEDPVDEFEIPGTESLDAYDLLEERFPGQTFGVSTAQVVFAAADGESLTDPTNQAVVEQTVERIATVPDAHGVTSPFETGTVAEDGSVAYLEVSYSDEAPEEAADARLWAHSEIARARTFAFAERVEELWSRGLVSSCQESICITDGAAPAMSGACGSSFRGR
jgi:putative drug exporter of the RND superfamily